MQQINQFGQVVTLIHLAIVVQGDKRRLACMPGLAELHETTGHPSMQRSDDPRAVTCPACKRSALFVEATARYGR